MENTEVEMKIIHSWFDGWGNSERKLFFIKLLTKVQMQSSHNQMLAMMLDGFQSLTIDRNSPSVFDCQLRLFEGWFAKWTFNEREQFLDSVRSKDSEGAIEEIYQKLLFIN